jgi:hypothetical protein
MTPRITRRLAARGGTAALTAVVLAAGMPLAAAGAQASVTGTPAAGNPYAPAYHHAYRHGAVPTISRLAKMRQWASGATRRAWPPTCRSSSKGWAPAASCGPGS